MQILRNEPLLAAERAVLQKKQKEFWKSLTFVCLLFSAIFGFAFLVNYWIAATTFWQIPVILQGAFPLYFIYQYFYPIYLERQKYTKDLLADEKIIEEFVVRSKEKSFVDKTFSIKTFEEEPFYSFDITQAEYDMVKIGSTFWVAYSFHSKTIFEVKI